MPDATDLETALRSIGALARKAARQPDVPDSLKPLLREIENLAAHHGGGDTPEPSDLPQTENQSL